MAAAHLRLPARGDELRERDIADGPQQPEPDRVAVGLVARHEAVLRELQQVVERLAGTRPVRREHHGRLGEVEPPVEHGDVVEDGLELRPEQVVAPRDRPFQRPLARRHVAGSAARERQVGRQPVADGRRGQERGPGRGELDAERQPVHERADLVDDGDLVAGVPAGSHGARTLDEQRPSAIQRRDRVLLLPDESQRRAAGHEQTCLRRRPQDRGHRPGRFQDLLEVVEDEEHRAVGQVAGAGRSPRTAPARRTGRSTARSTPRRRPDRPPWPVARTTRRRGRSVRAAARPRRPGSTCRSRPAR